MIHDLEIDSTSAVPIWHQLETLVRRLIARGSLAPGEAVPSVRVVARDLVVNPATVAKAYQRLVNDGLLEMRRGEGTFVAARPPKPGKAERARLLEEAADRFAGEAAQAGATESEAVDAVREALGAGRARQARGGKP